MRTFGLMALAAVVGYAIGVAVGYFLTMALSTNRHVAVVAVGSRRTISWSLSGRLSGST